MSLRDRYQNLGVVPAYGQLTAEHLFGNTGLTHEYMAFDWWRFLFGPLASLKRKLMNSKTTTINNPALLVGMFTSDFSKFLSGLQDFAIISSAIITPHNLAMNLPLLTTQAARVAALSLDVVFVGTAAAQVLGGVVTAKDGGTGITGKLKQLFGNDPISQLTATLGATNIYTIYINDAIMIDFNKAAPPFNVIPAFAKLFDTIKKEVCNPCPPRSLSMQELDVFHLWEPDTVKEELVEAKEILIEQLFDIDDGNESLIDKKHPNYKRYLEWNKFYDLAGKEINKILTYIDSNIK